MMRCPLPEDLRCAIPAMGQVHGPAVLCHGVWCALCHLAEPAVLRSKHLRSMYRVQCRQALPEEAIQDRSGAPLDGRAAVRQCSPWVHGSKGRLSGLESKDETFVLAHPGCGSGLGCWVGGTYDFGLINTIH